MLLTTFEHTPVLLKEALQYLQCRPGGWYIDGTVGAGGHARAILEASAPDGQLLGIDQDRQALAAAAERLASFGSRVTLVQDNFRNLTTIAAQQGWAQVDGILLDLGVSSYQLDTPGRGFSYQHEAPLDMRMNPGLTTTAADLVNQCSADELTRILKEYGEERWASRISRFIVNARRRERIVTTQQLVEIIEEAVPASARREGGHPARRTFQALRIAVNDELGALRQGLNAAAQLLRPGGRLVVITFHSLEDRLVKQFFQEKARGCVCPPGLPVCVCGQQPEMEIITRRAVVPSAAEQEQNRRARSAHLRAAAKLVMGTKGAE
ncbi:MAG: 16S rRNA (cytosine(1402)-N(4))-methyltransferase RsmH [Limnochordaceae bacterium]|nr:16S rRNA (cytosine(1402)-N(4))-methyltransferase RsmH [Limnochordaceae bacterium]